MRVCPCVCVCACLLIPFPARQAEWLKTAKKGPTRLTVGTVVRLADGIESDGPLRAGQLAVITTDDRSSNPYRVRTANGVEHSNWFVLRALVEAEGGMVSARTHTRTHTHTVTHTLAHNISQN
jgi:hypothetical protein